MEPNLEHQKESCSVRRARRTRSRSAFRTARRATRDLLWDQASFFNSDDFVCQFCDFVSEFCTTVSEFCDWASKLSDFVSEFCEMVSEFQQLLSVACKRKELRTRTSSFPTSAKRVFAATNRYRYSHIDVLLYNIVRARSLKARARKCQQSFEIVYLF